MVHHMAENCFGYNNIVDRSGQDKYAFKSMNNFVDYGFGRVPHLAC